MRIPNLRVRPVQELDMFCRKKGVETKEASAPVLRVASNVTPSGGLPV